ncbi:Crp/Fnr family transcriptional regulator [Roseibium sediminicola]|uniref:Crp/Fnr family transcriptional regulator n=1 Tax=Roseibium sediminicola TaxID=2933272 RepID=A0ABT0GVV0_9HYPH|nr:Crp/Fnr family transcriptional regulator [Roseibium sp. CAU 1639]MCK7613561.1 Crp/Fnr family transcriptional regulator [Roseibium sp. CAU 1639]
MTTDPTVLIQFADWLQHAGGVPESEALRVAERGEVRQFSAGAVLFSAGDVLETLYFIRSGLIRFFYLTPEGKEFNKNFVTAGNVATSLGSFLEARPSPFFAEALEETELVALPMAFVRDLKTSDIAWERLINGFVIRLALQKERREASFLLESATERYEAFLTEFAEILGRVPQYHIASYLGITPVALSRIRARRS